MTRSIFNRQLFMIWSVLCLCAVHLGAQTHGGSVNGAVAVHFKAGKLIEVSFLSVKPGMESQLNAEYFAKVMPIAAEYGMKSLAKFGVTEVSAGNTHVRMIGFFEWPAIKSRRKFSKDKRFLAIKPIRDNALSYLQIGNFKVEQDVAITFSADRYYEIYAMWMNPKYGDQIQDYFGKVGPVAGQQYGAKFPLSLKPYSVKDGDYHPHSMGIAEWPSKAKNEAFFSSTVFKNARHLRDAAVDRLDVLDARFMVQ